MTAVGLIINGWHRRRWAEELLALCMYDDLESTGVIVAITEDTYTKYIRPAYYMAHDDIISCNVSPHQLMPTIRTEILDTDPEGEMYTGIIVTPIAASDISVAYEMIASEADRILSRYSVYTTPIQLTDAVLEHLRNYRYPTVTGVVLL